ncbi:FG-GAP repeat domain-containing protein [Paenibacillus agricola]|uniref:VCBS repeat-containing protein n=1 Tax=Paenibacillus agricola TaxID=2716264 RepID=A0ABX0JDE6_9BACL|nr:VCBS repeat-containing protein [Paenibacillus agricola]NHN33274.1 VCBS repeat-containing protein [Paenibacillus agricola]
MTVKNKIYVSIVIILFVIIALFFGIRRNENVRLIYATNGTEFDNAAYLNFQQSYIANLQLDSKSLDLLNLQQLQSYDAIYLDPSLRKSTMLKQAQSNLISYVKTGGNLFVENELIDDFPLDFLGAAETVDIPSMDNPIFSYPEISGNLQGFQKVIQLFDENFNKHIGMKELPGFQWGKGIIPSTAQPIITIKDTALYTINRFGKGSVLCLSNFLPNRFFITGFDLQSGFDSTQGFELLAKERKQIVPPEGAKYFDFKQSQPAEPYFNFAFAAANHQLRNEYISFISKEKLGYSIAKVFGPYGRPAMAYQNHFEALSAIRDREGIQWAELLKKYNQIPSFSLIRSSFDWWQWKESVVAHLNTGTTDVPKFDVQLPNSFYSSGTHLLSGGEILSQATYPQAKELAQPIELPYRAYPTFTDLNGDGLQDLIAGSADGFLYRYINQGPEGSNQAETQNLSAADTFSKPDKIMLESGTPLKTEGYSSVYAHDLNKDGGLPDLLIGNNTGYVQYSLSRGDGSFAPTASLISEGKPLKVASFSAPAMGDVDMDGIEDLIVGDGEGKVYLFRGMKESPLSFQQGIEIVRLNALYAAPNVKDINGDGILDLVVGNSEGDLLVYIHELDNNRWVEQGSITGATLNQMGSDVIVGGHNSVPLWYDINHDGKDDLIVGQLEYGISIPIDNPNFPYKQQLQEFIDYTKTNKLELYPHISVHNYLNDAQEREELRLHRSAFETLGIPWIQTGANQHTWRINNLNRVQTLRNENENGIWFNFGFKPSYDPKDPQWGDDFMWGFPFLMQEQTLKEPMVLHTPTPVLRLQGEYSNRDVYEAFVQQDMPIDYFEHVEYRFPTDQRASRVNELLEFVQYLDGIRTKYDYNFMTEPQMAKSFLTTLTSEVIVGRSWGVYLMDKLKDIWGNGKHLSLSMDGNIPSMADEYRDTLGLKFEPGEKYEEQAFQTDSDIYMKKDTRLYVGLNNRKASITVGWGAEPMHILRANVPIQLRKENDRWIVDLNSEGMQQIKLYSPSLLKIEGTDLKVEYESKEMTYTVTHYGDKTTIVVSK